MSELPIIVWDVDDVLNKLMDSWLKSWNQKNDLNVALMNIKDNPPHEILKISKETYFNSLDDFRNSEAGINVEENSIVKNWFENHGSRYNHMACSARPIHTMPNQAWWIYHNYGQWIHTVHVAGTGRNKEMDYKNISKADFISWIDKEVLFIDDSEENVNAVSETGSKTMLYPQPWNSSKHSEEGFIAKLNEILGL